MDEFDYAAAAELYSGGARGSRQSKQLRYWRFATAALALQYAFETLPAERLAGATLEVNETRFSSDDMRTLYAADLYPLPRGARAA